MKRIMSMIKTAAKWQRIVAIILTIVFMLSAAMTGTMAWADMSQHKTNTAQGDGAPKTSTAILQKYEKDKDGNETEIPVPGAGFTLYKINADGTATPVQAFVTGPDGQVLASNLEPGNYYWQETRPAPGFLPESENGQPKKYPFSVPAEDGEPVLSTAYNIRQTGKLAITKTVKNADNSALTQAQKDMLFEFTVTFTGMADGPVSVLIDGEEKEISITNSKLVINLKSGQTAEFNNIPAGIHYEIIETPVQGYTISSENHTGNVPENGVTAAFTNTYGVIPGGTGSLTVTKQVTGDGASHDKEFTFTAIIGGRTQTFTLRHGGSKTINNIPFGTPYTVTENDYSGDGYTSTVREYSGVITAGNNAITLPFINHYDETPDDKTGSLVISKTVTGIGASTNKEFTFTVTFTGEGAPGSPQTFTLKHGQSKAFTNIPAGVHYTVTEADPEGYSPDFVTASGVIAGERTITVAYRNRVPESDGLSLTVTKRVEGNPPESDKDKLFHFTLTINGTKHEFDLKPGETSEPFTIYSGDIYSLTEQDYTADGYMQSGIINGYGTVGNSDIEIIQTNTYTGPEYIDIDGEKSFNTSGAPAGTKLPDSITIRLKNGNVIVRTITVSKENNWKYEFKNLLKHDALGNEIAYTVEEVRIPGWRPVVTGYDIENVYQPPVTDDGIEVEKSVTGDAPLPDETFTFILTALNGAPMPGQREVTITGAGMVKFGKITYTVPGTYQYTVTEKSGETVGWTYDDSVYTLTVTVTENTGGELVLSKSLTKNGQNTGKILFTNRYDDSGGETISLRVTKVWNDGNNPGRPATVQVQLYKDKIPQGSPVTLSSANNWTRLWTGLDKNAAWSVDEVSVPGGYTKTVSGDQVNGFTITNTKTGLDEEKTFVKVTKVWKDGNNPTRPKSVAAQLYKNGDASGVPVMLSESNNWTYTWTNLEKGPKWTVNEVNAPSGYSKTVTGDAANGFVITNTKTSVPDDPDGEEITISGKKTWNHGDNSIDKRPDSITVIIKANGVIVVQRQITAAEHWSWSFRMPKYGDDGKEISYTVDEARFYDYVKTVDGYNLINTYAPGKNTDDPNPDGPGGSGSSGGGPKTGDESNLMFWLVIMLISLALMILAVIPWKRRWDGRQYVAKY